MKIFDQNELPHDFTCFTIVAKNWNCGIPQAPANPNQYCLSSFF